MENKRPTGKFYYTSGPKTGNPYFSFKQFTIHQDRCAMKVCTDACLLGAWTAQKINSNRKSPKRILDIGAGTGLLSLMLAQKTTAHIDAVELNKDASGQARENLNESPWANRINVKNENILDLAVSEKYDLVICNPPFFENSLISADAAKNVAMHSTAFTLDDLCQVISLHMDEEGFAAVMVPAEREDYFKTQAGKNELFAKDIFRIRQTPGHKFFRSLLLLSRDKTPGSQQELLIKDEHGHYTNDFKDLLEDYYLHL